MSSEHKRGLEAQWYKVCAVVHAYIQGRYKSLRGLQCHGSESVEVELAT